MYLFMSRLIASISTTSIVPQFSWIMPEFNLITYIKLFLIKHARNRGGYGPVGGSGKTSLTVTGYGLEDPGIETRWIGEFSLLTRTAWVPNRLQYNRYQVFPGIKSDRVVNLTPHQPPVRWSRKNTAIPLLPLWTVRIVQNLSAWKVQL